MQEKLKGVKSLPLILALVFVSLLLYFVSSPVNAGETADEQRLAKTLSMIEGAGEVSVYIPESDAAQSAFSYSDTKEDDAANPKGVIIIASGADDPMVRIKLISAAAAALGINENNVKVYRGED